MIGTSVVVGVDDSSAARDAAVLGRTLARAAGGTLHLVTAVSDPLADVAAVRHRLDVDRLHALLVERARETSEANLRDTFDPPHLAEILRVRLGRPEHVLEETGRRVGASIFVVGGRHHDPSGSWIRRGTAHHLLRTWDRPVLVTGPGAPTIGRVLAAVDLSAAARPTIGAGTDLAELLDAELEVLHVAGYADPPEGWDPGLEVDSLQEGAENVLAGEIWPLLPDGARCRVERGAPLPTIREAAREDGSTLLVVGAQGRGRIHRLLLGSTTEALLAELPCSLAVIPVPPPPGDEARTRHAEP